MQLEKSIQNYLRSISGGAVNVRIDQARHIINLVTGKPEPSTAYVKLSRYNGCNSQWEFIRVVSTTDATINREIMAALENPHPPQQFYVYECYNSAGEAEGKIYSLNPELF